MKYAEIYMRFQNSLCCVQTEAARLGLTNKQ